MLLGDQSGQETKYVPEFRGSTRTPGPKLVVLFVFTHTTSSHLLYPHFARTSLPLSRPSPAPLPTHRKTKLGSAARFGTGRSCKFSQVKDDENGGSIRITSNLHGCREDSSSNGRNEGGRA